MIEDSQTPIILTQQRLIPKLRRLAGVQVIAIDTNWAEIAQQPTTNLQTEVKPEHLAYIIYTSGSTGKPKGVMVEHRKAFPAPLDLVSNSCMTVRKLISIDVPVYLYFIASNFNLA